ncbi:roadblock/LC7 domain-containing protein [Granulicoccus phenolivorans]|uniref:roadblock/LC7 domain-containing protein n=1 Tax=Granulicoccus phenolivorans TaxID=266854 RepID=UPI00041A08DD|nr:hypothetical protein [Granulicoccus phenolivorans]
MIVEGAQTDPADPAWELTGLDPSIAKDWHVWSMVLGRTLKPAMDELARRVPNLHSAMVCTSDGFNLCALNIAEDKVARMAALSSSLFALGSASGEVVGHSGAEPIDVLTMEHGKRRSVLVGREQPMIGHALVHVVAEGVSLGALLVAAQRCAKEVADLLDLEQPATPPPGSSPQHRRPGPAQSEQAAEQA